VADARGASTGASARGDGGERQAHHLGALQRHLVTQVVGQALQGNRIDRQLARRAVRNAIAQAGGFVGRSRLPAQRQAAIAVRRDQHRAALGGAVVQKTQPGQQHVAQGSGARPELDIVLALQRRVDLQRDADRVEGRVQQAGALRHQRGARDAAVGGGQFPVAQRAHALDHFADLIVDQRHPFAAGLGVDLGFAHLPAQQQQAHANDGNRRRHVMAQRRQHAREQLVAHASGNPAARTR